MDRSYGIIFDGVVIAEYMDLEVATLLIKSMAIEYKNNLACGSKITLFKKNLDAELVEEDVKEIC